MPRFVILDHDWPDPHFDFMLEDEKQLLTWRLNFPPSHGTTQNAESIQKHRIEYLDFEGPVSGNRGRVICWDRGVFEWIEKKEETISIVLRGSHYSGHAEWCRSYKTWHFKKD